MKVHARVGPAKDHHDEFLVVCEDAAGLIRGLKEMAVLFDPAPEIGSGKKNWRGSKTMAGIRR
jgi:hypothetical protein